METRYYLNLDSEGWLLSVSTIGSGTYITSLDEFDLSGYRISAHRWNGTTLVFDEEKYAELEEEYTVQPQPTALDRLSAQVYYTAMMTDTLLEEGE